MTATPRRRFVAYLLASFTVATLAIGHFHAPPTIHVRVVPEATR